MNRAAWIDKEEKGEGKFSVGRVWKDFRDDNDKVNWTKIVWFSQCITKHSFIAWIAMYGRPSTQDRVVCAFCSKNMDSHEHLFLRCHYSSKIWTAVKREAEISLKSNEWKDIIRWMPLNLTLVIFGQLEGN